MYITAMWVRSMEGIRGVNVHVHFHPEGLPHGGDLIKVASDPYSTSVRGPSRIEIKPGGNHVQAFLDVLLDDQTYTPERVQAALAATRVAIKGDTPNPLRKQVMIDGNSIYVVFSVNLGFEDPDSKRKIYSLLLEALMPWLKQRLPSGSSFTREPGRRRA